MQGSELLAPWRQVSVVGPGNRAVYYASATNAGAGCLPCQSGNELRRIETELDFHVAELGWASTDGLVALMIVNPKAGSRASDNAVDTIVEILREGGIQAVVRETERPGHAAHIVADYGLDDITKFAVIVSVGGDGTLHEVANGLAKLAGPVVAGHAPVEALPPLAVVPSGSGNAIAYSTGIFSASHAALNILHSLRTGNARPMAVMEYVVTGDNASRRARESVVIGGLQWGLLADVDQGTEFLRWMGDARFDVGGVVRIAMKTLYHARVRLTMHASLNEQTQAKMNTARRRAKGPGYIEREGRSAVRMDEGNGLTESEVVLEEEFVTIVAWNGALVSRDTMITPYASVTECEAFDVVIFRSGITRFEMLQTFLKIADGSFLHVSDSIQYHKVTMVEFESLEGQHLTMDGEPVALEPFSLAIAPESGKIRVLDSFTQ